MRIYPAFVALGVLFGCACATGHLVNSDQAKAKDRDPGLVERKMLRLVTFNLYNRPWERRARLDSIVQTLRALQPDVIALQEVATGWFLPGDPVAIIAAELGMSYERYWHETNLGVFKTGIAVLSRFPLKDAEYQEFDRHQVWDAKGYMSVQVQAPRHAFRLVNLHMASSDSQSIKKSEFSELSDYVKELGKRSHDPVIIAGDFNTELKHPRFEKWVHELNLDTVYSHFPEEAKKNSWNLDYREACEGHHGTGALLDYVFIAPHSSIQATFVEGRIVSPSMVPHPSDHCPVVVDLKFPD